VGSGRLAEVGILQRLFGSGRSKRRDGVVCYLRENGPIAYELDLFERSPRERADTMISSELSWAWKGGSRDWTHLTRISLSAFLADVPSGALLVGTEGELPTDVTDATVKDWIRRFSRTEPTPLSAVINVATSQQLLFVQQHASDAVNTLLDAWGVDKGAAARKAYPRLGPATLEALSDRLSQP
jgi:hypothetical protein